MRDPLRTRKQVGGACRLPAALAAAVLTTMPARGAPWTPADLLQPPALWLDASDLSASPVSAWNDKSGNNRNFAQATAANQPAYSATSFNGKPGVTFDGSNDFMSAGDTLDLGTQSLGIIAAVKYNTSDTSGMVISKTRYAVGNGRYFMGRFQGTGFGLGTGTQYQYVGESDFATAISVSADSSTSPRLAGFDLNRQTSGYIKNWIDGVAVKTSTFTGNATNYTSTDLLLLGAYGNSSGSTPPQANSYLNGIIAEIVVVQTAMTDADRQKIEGYLAWKWGMQGNLPADHPYQSAAPGGSDTTPPTVSSLSPADNATYVPTNANLVIAFNEAIAAGTGNITLKNLTDNTQSTIAITDGSQVSVAGAVLTINPAADLTAGKNYAIRIDTTAIMDSSGNFFGGIADDTTWNFTASAGTIAGDDFSTNPNIATEWTQSAYYGSIGTATWNAADQDLDLAGGSGDKWSVLRRTAGTRAATDPVTLEIKSLSASGSDWALVGLCISSDTAPTLAGTNPRYMFVLQTNNANGGNWFYQVKRAPSSGAVLYQSADIPYASLTFPIRLDIVRNGANYDFQVNGSTVYTASYYSSAQHDSMVNYHITWGDGQDASMTATVDNFGAGFDTTPPAVATLSPVDDATNVALFSNLSVTFNENVALGTGNITLRKSDDDTVVESFDVTSSPRLLLSGASVVIDPSVNLVPHTGYYVQIDTAAIKDRSNNFFAGIADTTTWNFTTGAADTTPPAVATLDSPSNGAAGVPGDASFVLTFSETILKGTGNIVIRRTDGSVVDTIDVTSGNVTLNGAQVTILPNVVLPVTTGLYVEIDAGTFQDLSGNPFAGISGAGIWSFSTELQLAITPNEPASRFQLSWQSWTGQLYNLRSSPDLASWSLLQGNIPATPPTNLMNINPTEPKLFFKVEEAAPVAFVIDNAELAVVLGAAPTPAETRVAELLAARITERSGIALAQPNAASCRLLIGTVATHAGIAAFAATRPDLATLGPDGYVIAVDQMNPNLYVIGQNDSGVVAGVGRLMREMRYLTGRLEVPALQLTEVPRMPNRGMYLWARTTYFGKPDQVDRYVEELALWGCNALSFWFEMGMFSSFDDPNAQYWLGMYRRFYATAKRMGMKTGLLMVANDAYNTSPADMRISPIIGTPNHYLCPHKPGALDQLLAWHEQVFRALHSSGTPIDIYNIFPADPGGCSTADCTPWPTTGLWFIAQPLAARIHQISPQTEIWLDTWHLNHPTFGGKDWENLVDMLDSTQQAPAWFSGFEVGLAPNHPYARMTAQDRDYYNNAARPLTVFPDISMYGNHSGMLVKKDYWKSLQAELNDYTPALMKGGWPYSERWNTDIASVVFLSWFWNPDKTVETLLDEYAALYFGPEAATGRYLLDLLDDASNDPAAVRATLATLQASLPQWVKNDWRWGEIVAACQYKAP